MKRCPECEFLYENESTKCDMDGTPLRFTATLPALPGFTRTICDKWTITLVALLVLGTVLVILYRATPRAYTSSTPTRAERQSPVGSYNNESLEPTASPSDSSSLQLDDADNSSDSADSSAPLSAATAANSRKSKRSAAPADEKEPTPASVTHVDAASSAQSASNAAPQSVTIQTSKETAVPKPPALSTNSISIHPLPPEATPNKAGTQNEKKDSGFKSFFKKAGKVLKKPFGEN